MSWATASPRPGSQDSYARELYGEESEIRALVRAQTGKPWPTNLSRVPSFRNRPPE
jgi:hypothetical protein